MKTYQAYKVIIGFLLFCGAYALINQYLLVHTILYRAAANDLATASVAILSFASQAALLLIGILLLSKRWFIALLILVGISAVPNMIYGQILNDTLDAGKIKWMIAESRQAANATREFIVPIAIFLVKITCALLLLWLARKLIRGAFVTSFKAALDRSIRWPVIAVTLLVFPSFAFATLGIGPQASERNIYASLVKIANSAPPPLRRKVDASPSQNSSAEKIIWLIDESISHSIYETIMAPNLQGLAPVDFGEAASMAHCSSPSNLALRMGINVHDAHAHTDLRSMPSIWAYAQKAGYKTTLIDGQISGPPQNIMLPSEQELIDEYSSANAGMETDVKIAQDLNGILKAQGKHFIYVVLRGVHFQYEDHYPGGLTPTNSSTEQKYETAVRYSKEGFFEELLDGVNRKGVAVFYTSDHGQNIQPGITPHCSRAPTRAEFAIPLVGFFSSDETLKYTQRNLKGRSASQIFPTTLQLMGYEKAYSTTHYDNDLSQETAQYVWFGRDIVPVDIGDEIDIHKSDKFPGSEAN